MLFTNIAALVAKGVKLNIQIEQADNGQLEVSVIPTCVTGKSGANLVAKVFVATPAELDADFASVVASFATINLTLHEQLEIVAAEAAEVAKNAQQVAKTAQSTARTTPSRVSGSTSGLPAKKTGPELLDDGDDEALGESGGDHASAPTASTSSTAAVGQLPFTL